MSANRFCREQILDTNATLSAPAAVAMDTAGNLYILDRENNRIRKVTVFNGIIRTVAGTSAVPYGPTGVAVDAGGC